MLVQQLVLDIMASDPAYWNPHASTLRQQRRRGNNKGRATKLVKGNNPTIDSLDRPPATFADLLAASSAVGASFGIVPMTAVAYAARRGVIPLAEARVRCCMTGIAFQWTVSTPRKRMVCLAITLACLLCCDEYPASGSCGFTVCQRKRFGHAAAVLDVPIASAQHIFGH